ncbi:MAG: helix-turn-helix domain-containing protein [Candidatus Xenobiia bacterium LiM19]
MTTHDSILQRLDKIEEILNEIRSEKDTMMDFSKATEYLALSKSHMYKLSMRGDIPHYKPNGKKLYFSKRELDQWLKGRPIKTSQKLEQEADDYITFSGKGRKYRCFSSSENGVLPAKEE